SLGPLGPILFKYYMADLPPEVTVEIYLYADDIKIFSCGQGRGRRIQKALDCLDAWAGRHGMAINPEKTRVLTVVYDRDSPTRYTHNDAEIGSTTKLKDPGVV